MAFFNLLSESEIEGVQSLTEDLLENTGFKVLHKEIRERARRSGAFVDDAHETVRIPRELLRELMSLTTPSYTIGCPDGSKYEIGGDQQYFKAIVTDPWIVDYDTRRPRKPRLEDVRKHTIIARKLGSVVGASCMDYPVTDVDGPASSLRALEEHLLHLGKHSSAYIASEENVPRWLEIGNILSGGNLPGSRVMTMAVAVVSPLILAKFNADILLLAIENDLPVVPTICPMAGTTSPLTMASTLVLSNAEAVFLAALIQMLKPGHPYLYFVGQSLTDLRSGHDMYYTLDKVLWKAASVQMGKSYGLPTGAETGGTMPPRYDVQTGAEGMLFMLSAYSSKANILGGLGSCYNANGMSAEMMIIQTGWLEAAKHLTRGINTDDLHMGLENIKSAGPGGNFLMDDLTMQFLRGGEFFSCDLFDYSGGYEDGPSMLERAHEKVEELTAEYESPLPGDIQENLRRFFHDEYAKMGGLALAGIR